MSTLIKNTLYRFKTARAPKKATEKQIIKGYVFPPSLGEFPNDTESVFILAARNNPDNRKAKLLEAAGGFSATAMTRISDIGDYELRKMSEFVTWLQEEKRTMEEIATYIEVGERPPYITGVSFEIELQLFENLYYQIITGKNPYLREEITNILAALGIVRQAVTDVSDFIANYRSPRVVVPKELFGVVAPGDISIKPDVKAIKDEMNIKTDGILLQHHLDQFNNVISEVKIAKSQYKQYLAAERKAYDATFKATTDDAYNNATKTSRIIVNPTTHDEKVVVSYDGLLLPEYAFSVNSGVEYFIGNAKQDSLAKNAVEKCQLALGHTSLDEVLDYLEEQKSDLTARIFQTNNLAQKQVSVGGAVVAKGYMPKLDGNFTIYSFDYFATSEVPEHSVMKLMLMGVPEGVQLASYNYVVNPNTPDEVQGNLAEISSGGEYCSLDLFISGEITDIAEGAFTLEGEFITTDGHKIKILTGNGTCTHFVMPDTADIGPGNVSTVVSTDYHDTESNQTAGTKTKRNPLFAKLNTSIKQLVGDGTFSYVKLDEDSNEEPEQPAQPGVGHPVIDYVPSGFGIKRMGIADYRKVEQEVCCYVPGEVSHIENVMAREYKEKSTRRLRRQEDTTTSSSETERESLSDSTSTARFEMNQEVASVLSEQESLSAGTQMHWDGLKTDGSVHADFANNISSENSDTLSIANAKEITERVMERVVRKVKEERVTKIVEEYEENNKHGFDNRKGDQHVSGVYRWVDKIYKNRIVNYGKRLIYEFMIPEPASFHNLAIQAQNALPSTEVLLKPIDPRIGDGKNRLRNASFLTSSNYMLWAAQYNAEVEPMPSLNMSVGTSFSVAYVRNISIGQVEAESGNGSIKIPEGYYATHAYGLYEAVSDGDNSGGYLLSLKIGNKGATKTQKGVENQTVTIDEDIQPYTGEVPVSFTLGNFVAGDITATVDCKLSDAALKKWKNDTFNAIISAYEAKLKAYNDKLAENKVSQVEKLKVNPLFYRQIENTVLRKNCIEYMVGKDNLNGTGLIIDDKVDTVHAAYESAALETYSARVKFMEEAFEWNVMSYFFYPFYWANRSKWQSLYNTDEVDDPLFRSFLQSGMARVMLTVRPGFEEAVNWYMMTGQVWNGGKVPTIDDPLFVSIIEELRVPEGTVEGEWESRIPTSLTVIQAGTIGLDVKGLPCDPDCDDYLIHDDAGNVILDEHGNPKSSNPITTPVTPVVMGNITNELEDVTATLETLQEDIDQIKDTLNITD